jgi:hypothetical protein
LKGRVRECLVQVVFLYIVIKEYMQ